MCNAFVFRPTLLSLTIVSAISSSLSCYADADSPEASGLLEEVVVTARKRGDESLQDIGGSIQALGGDDLSSKAALGFNDYMRLVPGLSANNSGSGQTQITIRGAASTRLNHANPNVPSTASVYLGETAVTASGFNPDAGLVDIARVEVLRGPQGTLFGASAMSGAIRIIPNAPDLSETTVDVAMSAFTTRDGAASQTSNLTFNLPLTDSVALRAVGYGNQLGGYIDNIYQGSANVGKDDYNSENVFGGRASLLWEATDNLSLTLTQTYQKSHADGRPDEYLRDDPLAGIGVNSLDAGVPASILYPDESITVTDELQVAKFVDETFDDTFAVSSLQLEWAAGSHTVSAIASFMSRDFDNRLDDTYRNRDWVNLANANWWDIDGDGSDTFSAGTGVEGVLNVGSDPLDVQQAVPVMGTPFENNTQMDRFAQEIRVSSDFDVSDNGVGFNYVAGLYYEDERRDFQQDIIIPGLDDWLTSFCDFCTTPAYGASNANSFFEGRYRFDTEQLALFGEASVVMGDFELVAGGRYFDYRQDADVFFGGFIEFSEDRLDDTIKEDGFSPKAELIYHLNDEVTLYTGYSEGFRLGSVQQFISGQCTPDLQALGVIGPNDGVDSIPTTIDSDTLENTEFGMKTTLFGGRTTVNATYYRINWDNARSQVFLGCGWIVEGNFVDIESSGLELNAATQVTENLSLTFNLGTNTSEVVGVNAGAESVAQVGDRTPMTPELTYSVGFDYFVPRFFGNGLDFFVRGDVSHTGDMVSSLGSAAEQANDGLLSNQIVPDNTVGNLFFGVGRESWDASLFIRNVTDERVITGVDIDRRGPAAYSRARPRNIGISLRFSL